MIFWYCYSAVIRRYGKWKENMLKFSFNSTQLLRKCPRPSGYYFLSHPNNTCQRNEPWIIACGKSWSFKHDSDARSATQQRQQSNTACAVRRPHARAAGRISHIHFKPSSATQHNALYWSPRAMTPALFARCQRMPLTPWGVAIGAADGSCLFQIAPLSRSLAPSSSSTSSSRCYRRWCCSLSIVKN